MELLSIRQAARRIHVAERTLRQAAHNGELPSYQLGKRTRRVYLSEVHEWVRSRRTPTWRTQNGATA